MDKLKSLLKEITLIKNNNEKILKECQNKVNYITQKENEIKSKNYFMANEIKKKEQNLEILKRNKEILLAHITSLNTEKNKLSNMVENFNMIEKNNLNNNYQNEEICKEILNNITKLNDEIEIEINNKKYDPQKNLDFSFIDSEIKNIGNVAVFMLKDSFYDKEDKDLAYNNLKEKEKLIVSQIYYDNRKKVENIILSNDRLNSFPSLNKNIIHEITKNEDSYNYYKAKIIREIESIANDDDKYKINSLNILLVGRKGVGKTTLIKYILDLKEDKVQNKNNTDFKTYSSDKIKYLKLIEVKGIGYDEDSTPEKILQKIKTYIGNLKNSNSQNYNNVINCIWYCISGPRFEEGEEKLFQFLKELYEDNIMPLILVFTKTTDKSLAQKMKEKIEEKKFNNSFISVMAEDMLLINNTIKKAFGKDELIETTLIKCTKALGSDMLKIMITLISENIKYNLIMENEKIVKEIKDKAISDFFEDYKEVLEDEDFIMHIMNIFLKNLNYFFNQSRNITNKSKNLILNADFISAIINYINTYKTSVKELIKPVVEEKAKEIIDIQAIMEQKYSNINLVNKRDLNKIKNTIEIFLKKNYYFMFQNYVINKVVNHSNIYLNNFLSLIFNEFKIQINSLINLNNKNDPDCILIRTHLETCFKRKVKTFSINNNMSDIKLQEESLTFNEFAPSFIQDKYYKDEHLVKPLKK